jgi:hypothetical protein
MYQYTVKSNSKKHKIIDPDSYLAAIIMAYHLNGDTPNLLQDAIRVESFKDLGNTRVLIMNNGSLTRLILISRANVI